MFCSATEHIDSYYVATTRAVQRLRPALCQYLPVDVCVVGAGYFGLHTALELARAGKRVAVLEASRIGWGASGRNGGQLNPGFACGMPRLQAALGLERARYLFGASRTALREIRELVAHYAIDCDLADGHLEVAVLARRVADLQHWIDECARRWDYPGLRFIDKTELPRYLRSERYQAGVFDAQAAHFHPLKFALGLARVAESHGAQIFERSRVLGYRPTTAHIALDVQASDGSRPIELRCDQLVLAANAYIDQVDRPLARRILPVGTFIGVTEVLGEQRARSLIPQNHAVYDNQFVLEYFRLTADHRLLFGGKCTYLGGTPARLAQAMKRNIVRAFPSLADVGVPYAWGGHIDITMRRMPDWGRRHDRIFWAQGFCGHGVVPTRVAARLVSEAVLGRPQELDWFARIRNPPFPGGAALGGLMQALGMSYYRLRDFF
jgi:glycine/D-amino acid oxidase-like deaminating enzyme